MSTINIKFCINFILCFFWIFSSGTLYSQTYTYPPAREDDVVDDYHGTRVFDPYRWMENADSKELHEWIDKQNVLTSSFIKSIPEREKISSRLKELWNYQRFSVPVKRGKRYFYTKNEGLQNQSVLYAQEGLNGIPEVLIDPNLFSEDGTVALSNLSYNNDGSLLAFGISHSGSDQQEILIRNIETNINYPETLRWCKFASVAWHPKNTGFYYNRYPTPGTVSKEDESYYNKVYWHELGTKQSEDKLIYERPDKKELSFSPIVTEDGKYLILHVSHGTDPQNRIYYRELETDGDFIRLLDDADASYRFLTNNGSLFYFRTDLDAPRGRIIAIDINNPDRQYWREVIPQGRDILSFVTFVNNKFACAYLHDAHHQLLLFDLSGKFLRSFSFPTIGSLVGLTGRQDDTEMFFGFTSFLHPMTIYRYDFLKDSISIFWQASLKFDLENYETQQVFFRSKDRTRIPMFLVYRKNILLDGSNPVLLYGYGGFNASITPSFAPWRLVWLESGGIFAAVNLRGGGEYGEQWHKAGMLENKQNVFDDFISAAEWLIKNKYTRPERLATIGGSNGGLLVSACMIQRPDLFGAVICQVPVTDMLRYHKFTVGRFWIGEYGNAELNPEHFKFLYKYSPLHNVRKGTTYPATLITTADHDDRVIPAHAMKFTAALQSADAGKNPILIRVEKKAGHGGGKPTMKLIEEFSDILAFLVKNLKMDVLK